LFPQVTGTTPPITELSQNTMEEAKQEIAKLKAQIQEMKSERLHYYASHYAHEDSTSGNACMPETGMPPRFVWRMVQDVHELDFSEKLNTSSYVNVTFEPEEDEVAKMGYRINLADQTVYPSSFKLHDTCVNMVANLWNCPEPDDFKEKGVHAGAQTVGSTEACLLAGLCLKFRWRQWYGKKNNLTPDQILGVRPNLVISTCFQAAWEKLFKYMDIEPRIVPTSIKTFAMDPKDVKEAVDDKTIGVVCIMGNHYGGQYDPVQKIDEALTEINQAKGFQVGIHVDAASGGFIAPFQKYLPPWDFRLPNVLSISASGHKFGMSVCGTGWVIWRQRKDLSEHVAISVSYLGGMGESYTLNFSRPATGVYVQFYKFMRLGTYGYAALEESMMSVAKYIRDGLKAMVYNEKPAFEMLDDGDTGCLPVVSARLNLDLNLEYNDIDLQHAIAEDHWYVSGYKLSMTHPIDETKQPLFVDADMTGTMFRVVVKSNLTKVMANDLLAAVKKALDEKLDLPHAARKKAQKHHHQGSVC